MGLDMSLGKVQKVEGMTFDELIDAEKHLDEIIQTKGAPYDKIRHLVYDRGAHFPWKSISHEIAYWRKANQVHAWFVKNVQGGKDDCGAYAVTKEQLKELLSICKRIKTAEDGKRLLPAQEGFFFGPTDYGDWYFDDIKITIDQLEKVLSETDFEKYHVYYLSSW